MLSLLSIGLVVAVVAVVGGGGGADAGAAVGVVVGVVVSTAAVDTPSLCPIQKHTLVRRPPPPLFARPF